MVIYLFIYLLIFTAGVFGNLLYGNMVVVVVVASLSILILYADEEKEKPRVAIFLLLLVQVEISYHAIRYRIQFSPHHVRACSGGQLSLAMFGFGTLLDGQFIA